MDQERLEKMRMEQRRGALVLMVLVALEQEHYGYSLRKHLKNNGLDIEEGTLYPLLRRLERHQLLASEWREEEGRKRRFYQISSEGKEIREVLLTEWNSLGHGLENLLEEIQ